MFDLAGHRKLLGRLSVFKPEWDAIPLENTGDPSAFHVWNNWFGPVDAEVLYAMLRLTLPKRMVEIGSGMSTLCAWQALTRNDATFHLTAIDPDPKQNLDGIDIELIQQPLQAVPLDTFAQLGDGDVLFIDSTHIWEPGNDVDIEYHVILPSLKSGVVVQCHDIFLPEPYPSWWAHRGYDEQDHLAPLLDSGEWEVLWASHFMHRNAASKLKEMFNSYGYADYPASLWMRKR